VARLAALPFAVCAVQLLAATGAAAVPTGAAVPLPDVAVLPAADRHVSLVVNVPASAKTVRPESVSVTVRGARQPTTVVPVISDQLAVGLVVDASEAGGKQLQAWLSAAARFVLETPAATRAAVIADTTPPVVVAGLRQGPIDLVRALSAVRAHGERRTSEALTLAMRQLPAAPPGPRVVVLYTSSPDAGGEAAAALAGRLTKAHALLVVVSTATDTLYWSRVTRATGGLLAPALAPAVTPALDQVAEMLRTRYLITFPTPGRVPAQASVRVDLGDVALTAEAVVPAADGVGQPAHPGSGSSGVTWMTVILLVVLVGVLTLLVAAALRPT
jgi:hypothetical protein